MLLSPRVRRLTYLPLGCGLHTAMAGLTVRRGRRGHGGGGRYCPPARHYPSCPPSSAFLYLCEVSSLQPKRMDKPRMCSSGLTSKTSCEVVASRLKRVPPSGTSRWLEGQWKSAHSPSTARLTTIPGGESSSSSDRYRPG